MELIEHAECSEDEDSLIYELNQLLNRKEDNVEEKPQEVYRWDKTQQDVFRPKTTLGRG